MNYTGIVIGDLWNNYCVIGGMVIEHKTCIHFRSRNVTECSESPCNEQNMTSPCTQGNQLVVTNGTENETVVSIFCTGTAHKNCKDECDSDFMVFNIEICKKTFTLMSINHIPFSFSVV